VSIGVVDDAFWRELARIMERHDLLADQRLSTKSGRRAHAQEVNDAVSAWTRQYCKAELGALLGGKLPFGPVNDAQDIIHDPHVEARGMIAEVPHADAGRKGWRVAANPIHFSATPALSPFAPPRLGEHNHLLTLLARAKPAT
jgi:crotonobetainyl-CoA:carnitine CoA-transferase CaiB-like acyl-CoA transferase